MTRRRSFSLLAAALVASAALGAYGASAVPLGASAAPPRRGGRHRGHPLEPNRGGDARRPSGTERRCATRVLDQHGHDPGRRVRRGQCDRAQGASALSPPETFRGDGIDGCCSGDRRLRRALGVVSTAPERAPFPGRAALLQTLSTEYATSLDAIADGPFERQGIAAGHAAADAMLEAREDDGRFGESQWVPDTRAGHWWPLLNAAGQPILDPTPWAGGVEPFLIQSSSQFRTAPPLALDSAEYAEEFNDVKDLGRATDSTERSSRRTPRSGGRARPSSAGTKSPGSSSHETTSAPPTVRGSWRCRTSAGRMRRSTAGTTSTTTTSGGRGTRYRGRRRTTTPTPMPSRAGRPSSQRRIPSIRRDTTASMARTRPSCACSSAT